MFEQIELRGRTVCPALVCAPMAGITHSAFRRLVADFGGYGALYTEMLSGRALLHEHLHASPFTKRRPCEGSVFYQLGLNGNEDIGAVVARLKSIQPFALDLNLGCPAPEILRTGAGAALFADLRRLDAVLGAIRRGWDGVLSVKCRLGGSEEQWREEFAERFRLFELHGVDAITVHPRFFGEKLKRSARWKYLEWIASHTSIPLIANGDITAPNEAAKLCAARGVMLGRIVVVKPWIFQEFAGQSVAVDYAEVWERFYGYVMEDFPPEKALGRLKEFSAYYSRNFFFGHVLFREAQGARSLERLRDAAMSFLSASPRPVAEVSVAGV